MKKQLVLGLVLMSGMGTVSLKAPEIFGKWYGPDKPPAPSPLTNKMLAQVNSLIETTLKKFISKDSTVVTFQGSQSTRSYVKEQVPYLSGMFRSDNAYRNVHNAVEWNKAKYRLLEDLGTLHNNTHSGQYKTMDEFNKAKKAIMEKFNNAEKTSESKYSSFE